MFCQFACSPHSWYFLLFCCALMSGRIQVHGVGPENAYPQLTNQHRQNQGDTKGEVVPLRIDEANKAEKHSDIQKPFILNIGNVSNSGPNTNDTKPVISDKVITSTDINIAAVVNNGSAVPEKPAWDGTSSATVSQEDMDSGALFRLFLVLSGLCAFSIVYVGYRFYRTRKGDTKPLAVRKYGVLTQRTDIEMLPLPLDDEDDDDTVFDVGNHAGGR